MKKAKIQELNQYQRAALRTAAKFKANARGFSMGAMGLSGEAGEVTDLLKKVLFHKHKLDPDKLKKELGDVLWYLAFLAHIGGMTLSEVATANVEKLRGRYPKGFDPKRSRERTK